MLVRVQRRGRLVEQHQLRAHGQRAGDRHALLLAAGKLDRVMVTLFRQADAGQQLQGVLGGLLGRAAQYLAGAFDDVLQHGQVRKQVEALKHHAGGQALAGDLGLGQFMQLLADQAVADQLAIDPQAAAIDLFQLVDAAQEGVRPGDGGGLAAGWLRRRRVGSYTGSWAFNVAMPPPAPAPTPAGNSPPRAWRYRSRCSHG